MDKHKRNFLAAAAAIATLPAVAANKPASARRDEPALLTVTGAIGDGNRGALDPVLDQLMKKQGVHFDRAQAFGFTALAALPSTTIKPTLEYDSKVHILRGPLLTTVAEASGAQLAERTKLLLRAIDGYAVAVTVADARRYGFIVATHLDGRPMPLGGLGPLWAVYDADRFPEMAARPISERFAHCPWGLYHIEVQ